MNKNSEIQAEQSYFDAAAAAREQTRESLLSAGRAASGPTAQISEVARGGRKQAEMIADKDSPVAFRKYTTVDGEEFYVLSQNYSSLNLPCA